MLDNKNILQFTKHNIDSHNNQINQPDKCKLETKDHFWEKNQKIVNKTFLSHH